MNVQIQKLAHDVISTFMTMNLYLELKYRQEKLDYIRRLNFQSEVMIKSSSEPVEYKSYVIQHTHCHLVMCTVLSQPQTIKLTPAPFNLLPPSFCTPLSSHVSRHKAGIPCLNRQSLGLGFMGHFTKAMSASKSQADYRIDPSTKHFDAGKFLHPIDYRLGESFSFMSTCIRGTPVTKCESLARCGEQRNKFYLERSFHMQDGESDKEESKEIAVRNKVLFQFKAVRLHLRHSGVAAS